MKTGLQRNCIDKYYTKPDISIKCVKTFKRVVKPKQTDVIIEPSAGNGVFIEPLKMVENAKYFYDIEPEHKDVIKQDFLSFKWTEPEPAHIIGNPPFGRQSSLAIKFIKKSAEFASSISFILPKSFKKESMQKHFPLNFHLVHEEDVPDKSFLVEGKEHDVPCVFQIWIKKNEQRRIPQKLEPTGFRFVKKSENPDIAIRRVGVYAGKVFEETQDKSEQSHYFIKLDDIEDIRKFKDIKYEHNNTVGPRSISKQEIISKIIV